MTTVLRVPAVVDWSLRLRVAVATVFVAGSSLLLVGEVLAPSSTEEVASMAATPDRFGWSIAVSLVAVPCLVGTAVAWTALGLGRSPRLSWIGGALMVTGVCALAAVLGGELAQYSLLITGVDPSTVGLALAADSGGVPMTLLLVMFLGGVLGGVGSLQVALWRSRTMPRGAVLVMGTFLLVDVSPVAALTGFPTHVLMVAGSVWMAVAVIRPGRRQRTVEGLAMRGH